MLTIQTMQLPVAPNQKIDPALLSDLKSRPIEEACSILNDHAQKNGAGVAFGVDRETRWLFVTVPIMLQVAFGRRVLRVPDDMEQAIEKLQGFDSCDGVVLVFKLSLPGQSGPVELGMWVPDRSLPQLIEAVERGKVA